MKKNIFLYSLFVIVLLLIPSCSAIVPEQKMTSTSNTHGIILRNFWITSDGHLALNITNIGNENISMQTMFIHFWGGDFFFTKQNVSTYAYIHELPAQDTQVFQTQHTICRISRLTHLPRLFLNYQLELTLMESSLLLHLKIIFGKIMVQPI